MAIRITIEPSAIVKMRERGPEIIQALVAKMDQLMIRLQSKIVGERIPELFPKGASNIPATVRFIPAKLEGTKIVGSVMAGGPRTTKVTLKSGAEVDYSAVQEFGIAHSYEILPFNKKVLSFILDGKRIFATRVNHPPMAARPFMRSSYEDLVRSGDAERELIQAFMDALNA